MSSSQEPLTNLSKYGKTGGNSIATPLLIDVYRSTDLVNDEFKILYSNIVVNTPKFDFNLPLNGHIGFFKIVYK